MGNRRFSSVLAVSDRGGVYSWEFLLDGDTMSSSILAVSDRIFHSWEFLLDGNFCKLQRLVINATTIMGHNVLLDLGRVRSRRFSVLDGRSPA